MRANQKGFKKALKFKFICINCHKSSLAADVKAKVCSECRLNSKCPGCGKRVEYDTVLCTQCRGKEKKGKTYLEIYGTSRPPCGYQPGEKNVAKRPEIRAKISKGVTASYTPELRQKRRLQVLKQLNSKTNKRYIKRFPNSKGELFRSRLEVLFSELLYNNSIPFNYETDYEVPILMVNEHNKIVDFIIQGVVIEISGYAFPDWKAEFDNSMRNLRESINSPLMILTYPTNLPEMWGKMPGYNVFWYSIYDEKEILEALNFCINLVQLENLTKGELCIQ